MKTIDLGDPLVYKRLSSAVEKAVEADQTEFKLDGIDFYVPYARILLQFAKDTIPDLETRLNN